MLVAGITLTAIGGGGTIVSVRAAVLDGSVTDCAVIVTVPPDGIESGAV